MATFNYPYSVASNKPMPSFGILDRSNTPISNPFKGFTNLFDANPNMPGVQIFNNPNANNVVKPNNVSTSNNVSIPNRFSMGNFPKARRSLLRDSFSYENPYRGDEMTGSFQNVGDGMGVTSTYGGSTIGNPTPNPYVLNQKAKAENNSNNKGLFSVPNTEEEYLKASGLLNQQGTQKENVANNKPKEKPKMTTVRID